MNEGIAGHGTSTALDAPEQKATAQRNPRLILRLVSCRACKPASSHINRSSSSI